MIDALDIAKTEAAAKGFDPRIIDAVARQEGYPSTAANPPAIGDNGCSYGLFQENICGGEGETVLNAGGSLSDLMDPVSSTDRFIDRYTRAQQASLGSTPGEIAAAAQRPADPARYAASVDAMLGTARSDTGAIGASSGSSTTTETCRSFSELDILRAVSMNVAGSTPAQIAAALGVSEACLKMRAGIGVQNIDNTPVAGGIVKTVSDPAAAIEDFKRGATQFGIAAIFIGLAAGLVIYGAAKSLGGPKLPVPV